MNMREKIARAVAATTHITPFERLWASEQRHLLETADLILDAMRDPTDAMTQAGEDAITYHPDDIIKNQADPCWQAMIDAALNEK